jgi:soluble lytic murein transglycosylase-like protein
MQKTIYISKDTQQMFNREISNAIKINCQKYKLNFNLIKAMIKVESNYNPFAIRIEPHLKKAKWYNGALKGLKEIVDWHYCSFGLMQVMYANTIIRVKDPFSLFDPKIGISEGCRILKWQLKRYKGNIEHAIAAYNQGNNRFYDINKNGIKDKNEKYKNQNYVDKVLKYYFKFQPMEGGEVDVE